MTDALSALDAASPHALRLFGFQREWVPTAHGAMHVLRAKGSGTLPPLVVLHGLGSSGADYAWAFGPFRRACSSLIFPDLFGHGASATPTAPLAELKEPQLAALAALIPDRAILLGSSLGGVVATHLYPRVKDRVAAMVLVSPGGAPMENADLSAFLTGFDVKSPEAARAFVDRFLGRPLAWARPYAWGVRQRMTRPHILRFIKEIQATDLLTAADVAAIVCPVMLYWGKGDRVIPAAARDWWFTQVPKATTVTPEHMGHAPFLDDPREFAAPIVAFLRAAVG